MNGDGSHEQQGERQSNGSLNAAANAHDDDAGESSDNAFVLASLLHELTFWEATPTEFMHKSQSVNDMSQRNDAAAPASIATATRSNSDEGSHSFRQRNLKQDDRLLLQQQQQQQQQRNNDDESFGNHRFSTSSNNTLGQGTVHEVDPAQRQPLQDQQQDQQPSLEATNLTLSESSSFSASSSTPTPAGALHPDEANNPRPTSPTLDELQAACPWQKAVDPSTGRTYYYDIETRQSQWDKPRQIRAIEKKAKKEQRQRLEIFFREMEANLMASLARGEVIPLHRRDSLSKEGPPLEPLVGDLQLVDDKPIRPSKPGDGSSNGSANAAARVRTISGMNEHLLAQLQQPATASSSSPWQNYTSSQQQQPLPSSHRLSSSPANNFEKGRPPLPRPPPSATTATLSSSLPNGITTISGSTSTSTSTGSTGSGLGLGAALNVGMNLQVPPQALQNWVDQQPLHDDAGPNNSNSNTYFSSQHNDDNDPLKQPLGEDSLRGEEFLDKILVDLEVSDDEDDSDIAVTVGTATAAASSAAPAAALTTIAPATTADANNSPGTTAPVSATASSTTATNTTTTRSKADKNGLAPLSHIRRNTAGTVHKAGTTMDKPDIDGTIHVVCGVIRAHIEQSLHHHRSAPSPNAVHVNLEMFRDDYELHDASTATNATSRGRRPAAAATAATATTATTNSPHAIPSLDEIKAFYREFYKRSQMEFDAIIMSLIYVERLIKETNGALMPTPDNWGSVVFSCMVLASKVWDDLSMWNIDFSNVSVNSSLLSSFSLKRINQLELGVLTCLNFAVTIPGSEYAKYYYLLRNMMIRGGLLDPFAANQPLSNAEQNRLEDRTNHYQECKLNQDDRTRRRVRSVDWSQLSSSSSNSANVGKAAPASDAVTASGHLTSNLIVSGPVLREKLCLEQLAATSTAATSRS